jgi:phenylpyruvate C(3)-methyltransferase
MTRVAAEAWRTGSVAADEIPEIAGDTSPSVAAIYNSAVAAWAIAAAWEAGALDELYNRGELDAVDFAARHGLDAGSTVGMFRALSAVGVVERDDITIRPTEKFYEVYRTRSFFHWLSKGSAELFRQMHHCMKIENRTGRYWERDSAAIAYACREINELCYDSTFWYAVNRLDFEFDVVADLGCGSGGRVMDMLLRYPGTRGIGIDIARPALEVARQKMDAAGLASRAEFIEADVLDLPTRPEFGEVDLLTCFMMGHDFWPRDNCVETLRGLRRQFPHARRLLLGDATRTVGVADQDLGVFTLGFELAHQLMDAYLPVLSDWESVFEEGGWRLIRTHRIEMAVGEVIFELA